MFSFRRGGRGVTNYRTITPVFASPARSKPVIVKKLRSGLASCKTLASYHASALRSVLQLAVQQPTVSTFSGEATLLPARLSVWRTCTAYLSLCSRSDCQRANRDARDTRRRSSAGCTARRGPTTALSRRPADSLHASRRNTINEPRATRTKGALRDHLVPRMLASALLAGRQR